LPRSQQLKKRLTVVSYLQSPNVLTRNADRGESPQQCAGIAMESLPPDRERIRKIHADAFSAAKQLNCGEV
jgi:hypothetical protein